MTRAFDVLDPQATLFGPKILEASAGTGKTFAIEHLVVRLLLEAPPGEEPLQIEEILAITYTKAAAREMRMRIRANLSKALASLQKGETDWPYLSMHLGSKEAIRRLEEALIGYENAQFFTIHGFCQRMLAQFALEARSLQPAEEVAPLGKSIRGDTLDFLEEQRVIGPEQMQQLKGVSILCKALQGPMPPVAAEGDFEKDCRAIEEVLEQCPYRTVDIVQEFERIEGFRKIGKLKINELREQAHSLKALFRDPTLRLELRRLLQSKLFSFVSMGNSKGKNPPNSPVFEWCIEHMAPLIHASMDQREIFRRLRFAWQPRQEKLLEERGLFSPDFLLERMKRALAYPEFVSEIRSRYRAAVIDEFQDTDEMQWEIFSSLFQKGLRLFCLVGDPKQSIYRFRNADLYTYFKARDSLGSDVHYSLDTNYRSSPELVGALNDLFADEHSEPILCLPGENRTEPYRPVKAGISESWNPGDGKQALQFFKIGDLKEKTFAYILREITELRPHLRGFSSFAILVQNHRQASALQAYLQKHSLPYITKSKASLGDSLALHLLEELFDVLFFPRDQNLLKIFLAGVLIGAPVEQLLEIPELPQLSVWKELLDKKGLAAFFREFLAFRWDNGPSFYEKIVARGSEFFRDIFQIIEQLVQIETVSFETIQRTFREVEDADPDEDARGRRRMDAEEDAIQIMTMHASKGLEFDVVFALGVASTTPKSDDDPEETNAEKLRQLYVALTRAKLRLYIPLLEKPKRNEGREPPLELLWRRSKLGSDAFSIVEELSLRNPHIALDRGEEIESVSMAAPLEEEKEILAPEAVLFPRPSGSIYSYSALARSHGSGEALPALGEGKNLHTFPRGSEPGSIVHKIFERIFSEEKRLEEIVQEEIQMSELADWGEVVLRGVQKTLSLPLLDGVTLLDLDRSKVRTEIEFFFREPPHFLKGFVDLLFVWNGQIYFLDWKTNWLGDGEDSYSEEHLRKAMDEHNYWLQASLYRDAIERAWPDIPFGGALYLFLRGVDAAGHGVLSFQPEPFRLPR